MQADVLRGATEIQGFVFQFPRLCVSIPFKRERVLQDLTEKQYVEVREFQFPSNGNADTKTIRFVMTDGYHVPKFQFPSNGKADPKGSSQRQIRKRNQGVSIPFKRESGLQGAITSLTHSDTGLCFNSLQTGKRIRISHQPLAVSHQQRGVSVDRKPLIAEGLRKPSADSHYSIPFKRESVSKVKMLNSVLLALAMFQFPSNGKVYPKGYNFFYVF